MDERQKEAINARRYEKLRRWMSSNVKEGWQQIQNLAAVACYVDWDAFDKELDALLECNVGLCETSPAPAAPSAAVPGGIENSAWYSQIKTCFTEYVCKRLDYATQMQADGWSPSIWAEKMAELRPREEEILRLLSAAPHPEESQDARRLIIERDAKWRNMLQCCKVPDKTHLYLIKPSDIAAIDAAAKE